MIGLDTNVFLRYLVIDDNPDQRNLVLQFMAERSPDQPAYISLVTLAETVWVLRRKLRYSQESIYSALTDLLASDDLVFDCHDELMQFLNENLSFKTDITDYLIAWTGVRGGCDHTITFDRSAAKHIPSMELLT